MRKPMDRIKDFKEIYDTYSISEIKPLLNNCLNCSEAFCSNKMEIEGKMVGCPLDIDINKVINLMKYNLYEEAYLELTKNNPFPEITSRICNGYCETSCICNKDNNPTRIRDIIRTLSDYAFNNNLVKSSLSNSNGKTISIIGSGIAGLTCANYLIKKGYNVKVYEKNSLPGGTLMYGTTNMRLDKEILKRRIELLKNEGVNFICNTEITRVISPMEVLKSSDALIIASGVVKRKLAIQGMGLKNVIYAEDYLKKVTKNILDMGISNILENRNVLVIGGGETTMEVISYAIREHAKMVACIDYKNMPPLKRTTSWPLPDDSLPKCEAILDARAKMGLDPRSFNMTVKEIIGNDSVDGAKIVQVKWVDDNPVLLDKEQTFPVDYIIVSIGNIGYEEDLINYFDLDLVNKLVNESNHKNNGKVFICGEALINNGVSVLALKDALKCAKEVEEYLEA